MPPQGLAAAEALAEQHVDAEVIDLRVLRPLDTATIAASVARTHRAVVVDEGWRTGGLSAEVAAQITEHAFWDLDAPVGRVCSAEVPMPYARHLEEAALPQVADIVAAATGGDGARWVSSPCRRSGPTWTAAPSSSGGSRPGDQVERGDIVAVVDTDKSTVDVEVFESGVVQELLVPVGVEVEVGTPLALIGPGTPGDPARRPSPGAHRRGVTAATGNPESNPPGTRT